MGDTQIPWANRVWNPVIGCSHDGCYVRRCYAAVMATRLAAIMPAVYGGLAKVGRWTGEVRFVAERLTQPLRWRKPSVVFVDSMGDFFHGEVEISWIAQVYGVMAVAVRHTFLILTKRPQNAAYWMAKPEFRSAYEAAARAHGATGPIPWPPPNVWVGTSASMIYDAAPRLDELMLVPAAVRFLSAEPLLGAMNLDRWLGAAIGDGLPGLDWVIAGCESGAGARPMDLGWVRSIRDQCQQAQVPFFYKQGVVDGKLIEMPALDGRTWDQRPAVRR